MEGSALALVRSNGAKPPSQTFGQHRKSTPGIARPTTSRPLCASIRTVMPSPSGSALGVTASSLPLCTVYLPTRLRASVGF